MRTLLLVVAVAGVLSAQDGPTVLPAHRRGPHEGEAGAACYRGETRAPAPGRMLYHCECRFLCETGAGGEQLQREADECETACGKEQCACHGDESCQMPMQPAPPRR
jgi:hypothetical protein